MALRIIATALGGFIGDFKDGGKLECPFQLANQQDKNGRMMTVLIPVIFCPDGSPVYFNPNQIVYDAKPDQDLEEAYIQSKQVRAAERAGITLASRMPEKRMHN